MVELNLSEWLKAEDFEDREVVTFQDEGELKTSEQTGFDRAVFEITIALSNGSRKLWTMNKTSQRATADIYGTNTINWIGKQVRLVKMKQLVQGKQKDVIYCEPLQEVTR